MASTINSDNGVVSGSVGLKYASDNSGVLALQTNGNTAVTITSANNVGIGTTSPDSLLHVVNPVNASIRVGYSGGSTNYYDASVHTFRANTGSPSVFVANQYGIGLGTTTPSSGMGIAFPATQVASTDANTLDDYEEGTWTPTFAFTGGSTGLTYNYQNASYIKIGRMVCLTGYLAFNNKGTSTGTLLVGNFPFSAVSTSNFWQGVAIGYYSGFASVTGGVVLEIPPSGTYGTMMYNGSTAITNSNASNGAGIEFAFCYVTGS
jgi:hypothetical protein